MTVAVVKRNNFLHFIRVNESHHYNWFPTFTWFEKIVILKVISAFQHCYCSMKLSLNLVNS